MFFDFGEYDICIMVSGSIPMRRRPLKRTHMPLPHAALDKLVQLLQVAPQQGRLHLRPGCILHEAVVVQSLVEVDSQRRKSSEDDNRE